MAVQSRSRATRTSGERAHHTPDQQQQQQARHPHKPAHHPPSRANNVRASSPPSVPDDDGGPPAKKRKLSIRSKHQQHHTQTTLDHHFGLHQSAPPKPPTKVSVTQPHGSLVGTVNGVRSVLDTTEDELGSRGGTPSGVVGKTARDNKGEDKRTLRSQDDGPRLKSELAIYFPNYEEIIFDAPKEEEFVDVDSVLYVVDDVAKVVKKEEQTSPAGKKGTGSGLRNGTVNGTQYPATPQRSHSNQFNGSPSLNLDSISRTMPDRPEDPLTDEHFLKSHNRAERKEKQLRNIEKERAMHEKVQLDRLLDGLKGHDWLKVLGITGITDGEAKKYEPKRDYFIAEVQALVDKFKQWKEQEKQQRLDKEAALAAKEEEEEDEEDEDGLESGDESSGPPSSDLNASAARQLQQETASALKSSALLKSSLKGKDANSTTGTPKLPPPTPAAAPSPEVPITSFYTKRHLRDAALGKSRHGRNVLAFGHALPELPDAQEFELPEDYLTRETIRANAREKRRRKRASVADASALD